MEVQNVREPAGNYDVESFSIARDIRDAFAAIREEYLNLNAPSIPIPRIGPGEEFVERLKASGQNGWAASWRLGSDEPNHTWLTYMLVFNGWFPPEAATKFPRTMELLRHPAFEAGAFFVLHPLSVVGPHAHSRLGGDKLTLHLGIDVEPERNFIHVDGRFLEEREGEVLIFDGSHEHFALNAGVRDRAILYCEFDRSKL